jgi:oxygen-independent coproporphyrinogen-3 oxidase
MKMSIGIYIHVPFCVRKCSYCDFYSKCDLSLTDAYTKAVVRNIKAYEPENLSVDTLYFGGGTPSLLTPSQIAAMIEAANPESGAEITMECNPQSQKDYESYFAAVKSAGVNRLSVGVQSLNDGILQSLGRLHDRTGALQTLEAAFETGFENVSADLMIGVHSQTIQDVIADIEGLTALPIKHISVYMLKIEPNTPLSQMDNSLLPDENSVCEFYLKTVNELDRRGFVQYEISNFAKAGFQSRHNLKYWNCEQYIGIGPAAHSYYGGTRFAVKPDLEAFCNAKRQAIYTTDENPGGKDERLMLGLRLMQKGAKIKDFPGITGRAAPLIRAGYLREEGGRLMLTPQGALVSNTIISELTE